MMPFDKSRYPDNWPEISLRIRERDGWKCKWCGVANGAIGSRDKKGRWWPEEDILGLDDGEGYELFGAVVKRTKIVLTVHHLGADRPDGSKGDVHDKLDCRDENLLSLCQRCHLLADLDTHIINAAKTRRRKRIEAGQMELL